MKVSHNRRARSVSRFARERATHQIYAYQNNIFAPARKLEQVRDSLCAHMMREEHLFADMCLYTRARRVLCFDNVSTTTRRGAGCHRRSRLPRVSQEEANRAAHTVRRFSDSLYLCFWLNSPSRFSASIYLEVAAECVCVRVRAL